MTEKLSRMELCFLSMSTSAQYRAFAEECDRLVVEEIKDTRLRKMLNEMAQTWRKLADEEDGKNTDC